MKPKLKKRLGDLLVEEGVLQQQQLEQALASQRETGRKLGSTLVDLGMVEEDRLLNFLAQQLNIPYIDISHSTLNPAQVKLLPEVQARRYRALVIEEDEVSILVGMTDPADLNALDAISAMLSKPVRLAVVKESQLFEAFDVYYRRTEEIAGFAQALAEETGDEEEFDFVAGVGDEQDTAVGNLLKSIFEDAVQLRASDIHIEPEESALRIRQRVDGVLQENVINQKNIAAALVLRLKLMCGLDISEKRLPQDGRTNIKVKGHSVDVRVSTMPIQHGESVVMRLLDQSAGLMTLEQTGMPGYMAKRFRTLLRRPHGMILVTGPTGSGKTTTLYGALSEMNESKVKIITVEDPVEYRLPRINQVQVNSKIGLNFSNVLRATLRQDPDVIMVGEMRDHETVEIGMRGALTGHLVLSTLHTNDAISCATRLLDMGAPGYLTASSLRGVIAQRLVRKICDNCVTDYRPSAEELVWLSQLDENAHQYQYKKGRGCQTCLQTGYKGRMGVFELLEMNEAMMNTLKNSDTSGFTDAAEQSPGYEPLSHMALKYASQGLTSVEEVLKLVELVSDDGSAAPPPVPPADGGSPPPASTDNHPPPTPGAGGLSLEPRDGEL